MFKLQIFLHGASAAANTLSNLCRCHAVFMRQLVDPSHFCKVNWPSTAIASKCFINSASVNAKFFRDTPARLLVPAVSQQH